MPGTLVHDALSPKLLDETAATSTVTGTAKEVSDPCAVQFRLVVDGTDTATDGTADIEVQGSDVEDFTSGVVSYGLFPQKDETADETVTLNAFVYKRYVRAVATLAGTDPDFDLTLTVEEPHYQRVDGDGA